MNRTKIFLKAVLFLTVLSSFFHIFMSFFNQELCFWNSGIIFGLFDFFDQYLLSLFLVLFLMFVTYVLLQTYGKYWEIIGVLLIASFTNILDRLIHGGVCDYIDVKIFFDFPIFNLNDIFISTALIIILLISIYDVVFCKKARE